MSLECSSVLCLFRLISCSLNVCLLFIHCCQGIGLEFSKTFREAGGCFSGFRYRLVIWKPLHVQNGFQIRSLGPIFLKQATAYFLSVRGDVVPDLKGKIGWILNSLSCNFLVIFCIKRECPAKEQIGNDSERPVVHLFAIRFLKQDFWGDIGKGSEWIDACLTWSNYFREAKIDDFELGLFGIVSHQNVLWFQITMCDTVGVQVVECGWKLVR